VVDISSVIILLLQLLISTIIIFAITKLMGEGEGIGRAMWAAVVGSVVVGRDIT